MTPPPGLGSAPGRAAARKNLFCGDVDARTANGAVAASRSATATATPRTRRRSPRTRCGRPTRSPGRRTSWRARPTTSPASPPAAATRSGPSHDGYVTRTAAGFTRHAPGHARHGVHQPPPRSPTTSRSPTSTAPHDPPPVRARRAHAHGDADADRARMSSIDDACQDIALANVDQDTAVLRRPRPPRLRRRHLPRRPVLPVGGHAGRPLGRARPRRPGRLAPSFFTAPGAPLSPSAPAGGGGARPGATTRSPRCGGLRPRCAGAQPVPLGQQLDRRAPRGPRRDREVRGAATSRSPLRRSRLAGPADGPARARAFPGRPVRRRAGPQPAPTSSRPTGASSPCRCQSPGGATSPCRTDRTRPSCSSRDALTAVAGGPAALLARRVDRPCRGPTCGLRRPRQCTSLEQSWDRPYRFEMGSTRIDHGQTVEVLRRDSEWTVRLRRW